MNVILPITSNNSTNVSAVQELYLIASGVSQEINAKNVKMVTT